MKLLLIQNMEYLYCSGGAHKANRLLMEQLAARGHSCCVITCLSSDYGSFRANVQEYGIGRGELEETREYFQYSCRGVTVYTCKKGFSIYSFIPVLYRRFAPDLILVTEDHTGLLMDLCLELPCKILYLAHTQATLPLTGTALDPAGAGERRKLLEQMDGVITVSRFMRNCLFNEGNMDAKLLYFPSYGGIHHKGLASIHNPYVTLINPSAFKGIDLFLQIARRLPQVEFAAVTGWGTSEEDLHRLKELPNISILQPEKNIDLIFSQTRILLVPSLWEEAFGQVVVEAQLRGIPVVASQVGGIPEAKCGTQYLLPVKRIEKYQDFGSQTGFRVPLVPDQDPLPWVEAIRHLLAEESVYEEASEDARQRAEAFVSKVSVTDFEDYFIQILAEPDRRKRQNRKWGKRRKI